MLSEMSHKVKDKYQMVLLIVEYKEIKKETRRPLMHTEP